MPVNINGLTGVTTPGLVSDGMPTSGGDPVVESGSNSDGEWVKWADGTAAAYAALNVDPTVVQKNSYPIPITLLSAGTPVSGGVQFRWGSSANYTAWLRESSNYITGYSNDVDGWVVDIFVTTASVASPRAWAFGRWK